ncbi:hypothetical protein [Terribacillus saccharophilus]|uniref:Response regulator aspartate phosphatase C n=1 Tax=Terribacillus saccharophilus TaxID=361277 RepID=A0ABX4GZD9_9BACI|nr:hypothetical protein [Terribacillus saccharophilus]PAD36279.1 hypothetical protein CHH56_05125 [Terribacillus saccharophilus]PAD96681.1 hypothetical protein CHH50_07185 [Terribacillus saccharophilus]PAE00257.1 hypothetical protein CHH48_08090 [Terribacillus saccharophilus]
MAVIESAEQFVTHLHTWHKTIKTRDRAQSAKLREEAYAALHAGEFIDELWDRFLLLDARFDFLKGDIDLCEEKLQRLNPDELNDYQSFFYYSFLAIVKYSRKEYFTAINLLEKAELHMHAIEDEEEHAGLHYNKAMQFYYLDINALSSFHLEQAISIYAKNPQYELKVANCKSLQGLNQIDLREFDKAENNLLEALSIAEKLGQEDMVVACGFNIGLMYHKQQADEKGIPYLMKTVTYSEHPLYVQALFTLTRSLYILGKSEQAQAYYKTGMRVCEEKGNLEYRWQFAILWAKYVDRDTMDYVYDSAITYFKENGLFYLMRRYARDYSQFLWEAQQIEKFHYYHKLALSNDFQ